MSFIGSFRTSHPSAGEQMARGLMTGLNDGLNEWVNRKARERELEQQVAAQEKLMELAHQQHLQKIAYQDQLAKRRTVYNQQISYTHPNESTYNNNQPPSLSQIIVPCTLAVFFISILVILLCVKTETLN